MTLAGQKVWLGTFATEADADRAIGRAVATGAAPKFETVGEFAGRWLTDYPRLGRGGAPAKASTMANYTDQVRRVQQAKAIRVENRLIVLADMRLGDVTRKMARAFAIAYPGLRAVVRTMFQSAVDDDLIEVNPFAGMRLPQSRGRADLIALTPEEVEILADSALEVFATARPDRQHYPPMIRTLVLTAFYTGIRPGELYGLQWGDLDLPAGEMTVARRIWGSGDVDLPKGGRIATILIPDPALQALRAMPKPADPAAPVFTTIRGLRLTQSNFTPTWEKLRTHFEAKLPADRAAELRASRRDGGMIDLYEGRHFCGSWMLDQGASYEDVKDQLRHSDTELLMKTYGHPDKRLARERLRRQLRADKVAKLRAVDEEADVG